MCGMLRIGAFISILTIIFILPALFCCATNWLGHQLKCYITGTVCGVDDITVRASIPNPV